MIEQRYIHSKVLRDWESKGGLARELSLEEATDLAQRVGVELMSTDENIKRHGSKENIGRQPLYSVSIGTDGSVYLTVFEDGDGCTVHLSSDMARQLAELLIR